MNPGSVDRFGCEMGGILKASPGALAAPECQTVGPLSAVPAPTHQLSLQSRTSFEAIHYPARKRQSVKTSTCAVVSHLEPGRRLSAFQASSLSACTDACASICRTPDGRSAGAAPLSSIHLALVESLRSPDRTCRSSPQRTELSQGFLHAPHTVSRAF